MSVTTYDNLASDPDTPNSGEVKFYMKNKAPTWRDDTGAVHTLQLPVFGNNVDLSVHENYQASTSGTAWSTYAGMQFPVNVSGTFIVFVEVICRINTTGGDAKVRLALDGTQVGSEFAEEFKDGGTTQRVTRMFLKKVDITGGEYLDLDFATERSGDTMTIYEGALVMWQVL